MNTKDLYDRIGNDAEIVRFTDCALEFAKEIISSGEVPDDCEYCHLMGAWYCEIDSEGNQCKPEDFVRYVMENV